jgi:hypothetical protein
MSLLWLELVELMKGRSGVVMTQFSSSNDSSILEGDVRQGRRMGRGPSSCPSSFGRQASAVFSALFRLIEPCLVTVPIFRISGCDTCVVWRAEGVA